MKKTLEAVTRVIIYARLSQDRDGTQTATARQIRDCKHFAKSQGWRVIEVIEDVDFSAFDKTVTRPGYERMLAMVESGEADMILTWKFDRLCRRFLDFARIWQICEPNNCNIASVKDGGMDTSTPFGRIMVQILIGFAEMETTNMSMRMRAMNEEKASNGKPHNGRGQYGYDRQTMKINKQEQHVIKQVADEIIAGKSMRSIVLALNDAGIPAPRSSKWTTSALRTMLMSPSIVGDRVHNGDIVKRDAWHGLISREKQAQVKAVLNDPKRVTIRNGHASLLTGVLRCGKCDARMMGGRVNSVGNRMYFCPPKPNGCNGVGIQTPALDEFVSAGVLGYIDTHVLNKVTVEDDGALDQLLARLEVATAKINQLEDDYRDNACMSAEEYKPRRQRYDDERGEIQRAIMRQREEQTLTGRLHDIDLATLAGTWPTLPIEAKRTVIARYVNRITIASGIRGRVAFDDERVNITFI